jgi:hypothetical protein
VKVAEFGLHAGAAARARERQKPRRPALICGECCVYSVYAKHPHHFDFCTVAAMRGRIKEIADESGLSAL